jgi:hypothetical protein
MNMGAYFHIQVGGWGRYRIVVIARARCCMLRHVWPGGVLGWGGRGGGGADGLQQTLFGLDQVQWQQFPIRSLNTPCSAETMRGTAHSISGLKQPALMQHFTQPPPNRHPTATQPPAPPPQPRLESCLRAEGRPTTGRITFAGRPPSASTATGFGQVHAQVGRLWGRLRRLCVQQLRVAMQAVHAWATCSRFHPSRSSSHRELLTRRSKPGWWARRWTSTSRWCTDLDLGVRS